MSYLTSVVSILVVSAGIGWGVSRMNWKFSGWDEKKLVWWVAVLFFLVNLGVLYYKLEALQMGGWDFSIYDSILRNAAAGKGLMLDFRGPFDHFTPLVLLIAPLYLIWDNPFWLLLIQPAVMAFAAPLLYAVSKHYFPRGYVPLLLTLMYFFDPYYTRLVLYDFHIECFYPLFFFTAFYCFSRKKMLLFALCLMLAPLLKEDFVVPLGAVGLWLLFRKGNRALGFGMICVGIFWALFVLKVYYPYILGVNYWHAGRYVLLGATAGETWENILVMAGRFFRYDAFLVMTSMLLPFVFLPLVNWRTALFLWLPTIGIHLVSNVEGQQYLRCHYASALIAVTPVAALWGARTLRVLLRKHPPAALLRKKIGGAVVACMVLCHVVYADLPFSRYGAYIPELPDGWGGVAGVPLRPAYWGHLWNSLNHAWDCKSILADLPITPETRIVAQNELTPLFLRKARIYDFPELGIGLMGTRPDDADIYLLDSVNFSGETKQEPLDEFLRERAQNPAYQTICYPNGLWIIIKKSILIEQARKEAGK